MTKSLRPNHGPKRERNDGTVANEFQIELQVFPPTIIAGEEFFVETLVRNIGTRETQFRESLTGSPFIYELINTDDASLECSISESYYYNWKDPQGHGAQDEWVDIPLGIAEEMGYRETLSEFLTQPIPPGHYRLVCTYDDGTAQFRSSAIDFEIIAPMPVAQSQCYCPTTDTHLALWAHRDATGHFQLLQRESIDDNPADGSFRLRRKNISQDIRSTASAIPVSPTARGRWFSWIEENRLAAAKSWGDALTATPPPLMLDATDLQLLDLGLQDAAGDALFFAYDISEPFLRAYHCSEQAVEMEKVPLPFWPALTARMTIVGTENIRLGQTVLIWATKADQTTRVYAASLDQLRNGEQPLLVAASTLPLSAWASPIVDLNSPPVLRLLWGPGEMDNICHYQRIGVGGGETTANNEQWAFTPPNARVDLWVIAPSAGDFLPVVAKSGSDLLWVNASASKEWQTLPVAALAERPTLSQSNDGQHWLTYFASGLGQRYLALGEPSPFDEVELE